MASAAAITEQAGAEPATVSRWLRRPVGVNKLFVRLANHFFLLCKGSYQQNLASQIKIGLKWPIMPMRPKIHIHFVVWRCRIRFGLSWFWCNVLEYVQCTMPPICMQYFWNLINSYLILVEHNIHKVFNVQMDCLDFTVSFLQGYKVMNFYYLF